MTTIDRVLDAPELQLDARTLIHSVHHSGDDRTIVVNMEDGRSFLLGLDTIQDADPSPIKRRGVSSNHHYVKVTQESGNVLEIPWDVVLHHCDPAYEHYKGRQSATQPALALRIGRRVRDLRGQKGLAVAELARRAGMQRPNLSRLEAGKHVPSLDTLERVAAALDVPVAELVATSARSGAAQSGSHTIPS